MQDALFQLIKSLTKNEKRYFTLFASAHRRDTQHLRLFALMEKQKEYDEESLRAFFRENGFSEQLHVAKNYLYRLILRSLRAYHSEISINTQIKDLLRNVEILHRKGLMEQCRVMLRKARSLAEENDQFHNLIEIAIWERTVAQATVSRKNEEHERTLGAIYAMERQVITDLSAIADARHVFDRLTSMETSARTPEMIEAIRERVPTSLIFSDIDLLGSYQAKAQVLYARLNYLFAIGDLDGHRACCLEFLSLVRTQPANSKTTQHQFVALDGILRDQLYREQWEEMATTLPELLALKDHPHFVKTRPVHASILHSSMLYRCSMLIGLGEFVDGMEEVTEIERNLEFLRENLPAHRIVVLRYCAALLCFGANRHDDALIWLNEILNEPAAEDLDIYPAARILQIVVHYEMGNESLLEYLLRSCHRYLYRRNKLFKVEEVLLRSLRCVLRAASRTDLIETFRQLARELHPLERDPFEQPAFELFDFAAWTESKIDGITFAEAVRRRAARKRSEQE